MCGFARGLEREKEDQKMEKEMVDGSKTKGSLTQRGPGDSSIGGLTSSCPAIDADVRAATFLDVAVLRCLFVPQWQEEGVHWALQFLYHRHVYIYILIFVLSFCEHIIIIEIPLNC